MTRDVGSRLHTDPIPLNVLHNFQSYVPPLRIPNHLHAENASQSSWDANTSISSKIGGYKSWALN